MAQRDVVSEYVSAALDQLRRGNGMRLPLRDMPEEMRDRTIPDSKDWIGWKPVPSTVTEEQLDELEREIGLAFPPPYRRFLRTSHFYELTEVGVRFERHPVRSWRAELVHLYEEVWWPERIIGRGLIPFGSETFCDTGLVCFDTRSRQADGDCPVVIWDHEWMDTDREVQPMFSSSLKMFECLCIAARDDTGFCYYDPQRDTADDLAEKRRQLRRFLACDPDGAGGPARAYWTSFVPGLEDG
jgi:hypothetical protein